MVGKLTRLSILPDGVVSKNDMGACKILERICEKKIWAVLSTINTKVNDLATTNKTERTAIPAYTERKNVGLKVEARSAEVSYANQ